MVKIDGAKLRAWRERRLLSLRDLGAKSGVQFHTIHALETGKQEPRPSTLRKLVAALEIEPDALLPSDNEENIGQAGTDPSQH